jgi:hypothetical protein
MSSLPELIESKIQRSAPGGCWLWTAAVNQKGYGLVSLTGFGRSAHRVVYEILVGPIPPGLQLDHLCRNPPCVNPDHLEPVTPQENSLRGIPYHPRKTHCPQGHPYDAANGYVRSNGTVECRECSRARNAKYERANRAARTARVVAKYHADPEYRERAKAAARERYRRKKAAS